MKKRDIRIDSLKGLLILIVVLRHIFQIAADNTSTDYISNLMAAVEMPLFICISGYFGGKCWREVTYNIKEFISTFVKKTRSYIIPFLSYYIIFKMIFTNGVSISLYSLLALVNNITLSLWYLFVIWVLSLVLNISLFISINNNRSNKRKCIIFLLVFSMCMGILGLLALNFGTNFLGLKLVLYYSIFYLLGYLYRWIPVLKKLIYNDITFAICTITYFVGCRYLYVLAVPDLPIYICSRFLLAIAGICVLIRLNLRLPQKCTAILSHLGLYTLEIYYMHSFLMTSIAINKADILMSYQGLLNSFVLICYLVITIPLIIWIIKSNKYTNLLLLGKKDN